MDHNEAVRLHAVEKYLLGEFPQAQRDEYEEHYFTCAICADDLKTGASFMDGARLVLVEESFEKARAKSHAEPRPGWFVWLRPAFAVPVFAALLVIVGYQNAITIPGLNQRSQQGTAEVFQSFFLDLGSRGEGSPRFAIRPGEALNLEIDLAPGSYVGQIQDDTGRTRTSFAVSAEQSQKTVHVRIPGNTLDSGKYNLVVARVPAADAQVGQEKEPTRVGFTVEFKR